MIYAIDICFTNASAAEFILDRLKLFSGTTPPRLMLRDGPIPMYAVFYEYVRSSDGPRAARPPRRPRARSPRRETIPPYRGAAASMRQAMRRCG